MLTNELMGLALLAISWTTALMIAWDALIDVQAWRRRLARWKGSLARGTVQSGELAALEVEQRARLLDGKAPAVGFFERGHVSRVLGGQVKLDDGAVVEVTAAADAQVWPEREALVAAAQCESAQQFDGLAAQAKGKGALRTVRVALAAGKPVWLAGARDGNAFKAELVSAVDPRTVASGKVALCFGVLVLNLAWEVAGTALVLWPPVFGQVSTVGAMVLLGHFLGMTPLAIAARYKVKTPAEEPLLGQWQRPGGAGAGVSAAA